MAFAGDEQPYKVSFDDYLWEQDEEWQNEIEKLQFPASFDESKKERRILKRKQKYFKAKIDPDFQLTIFSDRDHQNMYEHGWIITSEQFTNLEDDGYCAMGIHPVQPMTKSLLDVLIHGWFRSPNHGAISCDDLNLVHSDIPRVIATFCHFSSGDLIQLESGGEFPHFFLTTKVNLSLSTTLCDFDHKVMSYKTDEIPSETLHHVVKYLSHHKGKEPDPLPCPVRSMHMAQIVSDKWDATFMDPFDKKTIFEIILAANELDIKSLLHLGCAKIATLIKQLDQQEINRIIEEEETYRREHAQATTAQVPAAVTQAPATVNNDQQNDNDSDDEEDDEDGNSDEEFEEWINNDDDENAAVDGDDGSDHGDIRTILRQLSNGPRGLSRRLSSSILEMADSMEVNDGNDDDVENEQDAD